MFWSLFSMCRGEDLNLHGSPRLLLRQVRIPISPPRHVQDIISEILKKGMKYGVGLTAS